ncbi:alpha/beta fold hydrolase [Sediminitomix flava]|uniref:Pimeloyl-ACP methyl ester carboxylesterase n=1 Tax=Sediminitomix flava TaxID=379075 RepID=A0A316A4T5_SEDFL|nr:alpha/beta hydrolase [Sediminitomix flava]PWJ44777.1 pimeloyl-ACP methyl ester carboxylesterase [Sediminitomix flava]
MLSLKDTEKGTNTILLVHGFCETADIWDDIIPYLSDEFRVIAIDLPGFGRSPMLEKTTISGMANSIKNTIDQLDISKIHIIGHSLGGYVSLSFAQQYPEKVAGLTLFHSTVFEDGDEKKNTRTKAVQFLADEGVEKFTTSMFRGLFSTKTKKEKEYLINQTIKNSSETALEAAQQTMLAMRDRDDSTEWLKQTDIPIQFLIGNEDQAVSLDDSLKQCHLAKNNTVHFYQDVGHMGMLEAPQKTAEDLLSFAQKIYK